MHRNRVLPRDIVGVVVRRMLDLYKEGLYPCISNAPSFLFVSQLNADVDICCGSVTVDRFLPVATQFTRKCND